MLFATLFIVSQIVASVLVATADWGFVVDGEITDFGFMATYLLAMLLAFVLISLQERFSFGELRPIVHSIKGLDPVTIFAGVVLIVAITVVMSPLSELLPEDSRSFPVGPWTMLSVVVLAPLFEELIFRGRLYNILGRTISPLFSALLSAFMFGAIHLEPIVVIEGFVVGLVFSYYYIQKSSILTPMILHGCSNALAYALTILSYRDESLLKLLDGHELLSTIAYVVSAIIVLVGGVVIIRRLIKEGR